MTVQQNSFLENKHSCLPYSLARGRGFSNKAAGSVTVQPCPGHRRTQGHRKVQTMNFFFCDEELRLCNVTHIAVSLNQPLVHGKGAGRKLMSSGRGQHYWDKKLQRKCVAVPSAWQRLKGALCIPTWEGVRPEFQTKLAALVLCESSFSLSESCPAGV